jgi:hypothetical protein
LLRQISHGVSDIALKTWSKAFNASSRSSSILTLAIYEVSKTPCDIWRNKSLDVK